MEKRPTLDGRPTLERKLTARDLNIEGDSDAESISVEGARADNDSVHSTSQRNGESGDVGFLADLASKGMPKEIIVSDVGDCNSEVSFSDKSYIMDLGKQQATREETIRREAFEDAHVWYGKAIARGMPESKEFFTNMYNQLIEEVREKHAEFHKKQDKWLDQALEEYRKNLSEEQLTKIQKNAPTDDDLKKQKLAKKISKTKKLMKKALKNEGRDSEAYRNYEKKLAEYRTQSDEKEVVETAPSNRKSKVENGTSRRKSTDDASTKTKSKDRKSVRVRRSSAKKYDLGDDDEASTAKSVKTTRTAKTKKKKKDKRDSKSPRSSRSIAVDDGSVKKVSSGKSKSLRSSRSIPVDDGSVKKRSSGKSKSLRNSSRSIPVDDGSVKKASSGKSKSLRSFRSIPVDDGSVKKASSGKSLTRRKKEKVPYRNSSLPVKGSKVGL